MSDWQRWGELMAWADAEIEAQLEAEGLGEAASLFLSSAEVSSDSE